MNDQYKNENELAYDQTFDQTYGQAFDETHDRKYEKKKERLQKSRTVRVLSTLFICGAAFLAVIVGSWDKLLLMMQKRISYGKWIRLFIQLRIMSRCTVQLRLRQAGSRVAS